MPSCPLCRLCRHDARRHDPSYPGDLKTKLFLENDSYVVVEDLDPKGFKLRVLGVYKGHVADGELSDAFLNGLVKVTVNAAWEHCLVQGGRIAGLDVSEHSIRDHAHVQVGVR